MHKRPLHPKITRQDGMVGYAFNDLKEYLTEQEFINFSEWMYGHTTSILPDGQIMYYASDFERWRAGLPIID